MIIISGFTYSENEDQIILRRGKTGTVVGSNSLLCIYPSSVIIIDDKGKQKRGIYINYSVSC